MDYIYLLPSCFTVSLSLLFEFDKKQLHILSTALFLHFLAEIYMKANVKNSNSCLMHAYKVRGRLLFKYESRLDVWFTLPQSQC